MTCSHRTPTRLWMTLLVSLVLTGAHLPLQAQKLSPSQAADSARDVTGGKVLKVRPLRSGSTDYRIKMLLPEGKVRNIVVDGNSGEVKKHSKTGAKKPGTQR